MLYNKRQIKKGNKSIMSVRIIFYEEIFNRDTIVKRWLCHPNTIKNYVRMNLLPTFRTPGGRCILFPLDTIEEYEQSQNPQRKVAKKTRGRTLSAQQHEWRAEL